MSIREILVMHHSHTDLGYTHPQPVVWELHRRYIDHAIDLCEQTAEWDEPSQVRWTCEVTATLMSWLDSAPAKQVDRFANLVAGQRIGIGAMLHTITPLLNADQCVRSLAPIGVLRERFDAQITMAINHDVNGVPWLFVDLLSEIGVNHLLVGINDHFGGSPLRRQQVFDWASPEGKSLRVLNADHYHSFDRWLEPHLGSTDRMAEGWARYRDILAARGYIYDFVLMSATHHDLPDNNPPSRITADAVRRWNAEGRHPVIRYVTPEQLIERIDRIPSGLVESYCCDWPDYWNFGCASSARETRINQRSKNRLRTAEWLHALVPGEDEGLDLKKRLAWSGIQMYDEHTWGSWASIWNETTDDVAAGNNHTAGFAYEGRAWSGWVIREVLEQLFENPPIAQDAAGMVLINPGPNKRTVILDLPSRFANMRWEHHKGRVQNLEVANPNFEDGDLTPAGPYSVGSYSMRFVPLSDLKLDTSPPNGCSASEGRIESPGYLLTFDPEGGGVLSIFDKVMRREIVDVDSPWRMFSYINESVDPSRHAGHKRYQDRDAFFDSDFEKMQVQMKPGWIPEWPARRRDAGSADVTLARVTPVGAELELRWAHVSGGRDLAIQVTLPADRHCIDLKMSMRKEDNPRAESAYIAFPLALDGWGCHYDVAGRPVALDDEQLPGAVRDYQTVGRWVAVHNESFSVTLACPDAPMVQVGGFHFGKTQKSIPRENNCLLLAWPMNNYWDTNFPATQPGYQSFRYSLTTNKVFAVDFAARFAEAACFPIEWHPVVRAPDWINRPLINIDSNAVTVQSVKRSSRSDSVIVQIDNPTDRAQTPEISLPLFCPLSADIVNALEESCEQLHVEDCKIKVKIPARSMRQVRFTFS